MSRVRVVGVERPHGAFQEPVTAGQIEAMCRRAFGDDVHPVSAVELGLGAYNTTYRLDLGTGRQVILRVAPRPDHQYRIERELMRNEHAAVACLAPIASLMPRTLAVDFGHDLLDRDYLFQTVLDGVPAPAGLLGYARAEWAGFFRQLGTITRAVHEVRGERFGPVAGPTFATWSHALIDFFEAAATDLDDAGLDARDVREIATLAATHCRTLDEIREPRLLHGDLWTVNVMVEPGAAEPTITGVCDSDRVSWGDPLADWTIYRAGQRPGTERDGFWETYGRPVPTPATAVRSQIYLARHIVGARLERHRLGKADEIAGTYDDLSVTIRQLQ